LSGGTVTPTTPAKRPAAASRVTRAAPRVMAASSRGVPQGERPSLSHPRSGDPASTERPPEPKAAWEESWSSEDSLVGAGVAVGADGDSIRWDGVSRKLIRRRDPRFPAVLSALGQEVECEARITVAPTGGVTRVEITRSSGYTEIDAGVEAALRDYLFSRADGSAETVGTVRFHFRLEKTD
jgi:TonB family protein